MGVSGEWRGKNEAPRWAFIVNFDTLSFFFKGFTGYDGFLSMLVFEALLLQYHQIFSNRLRFLPRILLWFPWVSGYLDYKRP